MKETVIVFDLDGSAECLDTGALPFSELGEVTRSRASHVEPVCRLKRIAFWILRWATGEQGRVSDWTRRWVGPWQVRFPGSSKVHFRHESRAECINWEVATINSQFLNR
jgi:hypothetical protein